VATVHYHRNYNNLFWNGSQLAVGGGDGEVFGNLASSPTMIGRGLANGVVQFTAGFRPLGQQGALAVHFADVFGVLFEQWLKRQPVEQATWLIGADVLEPELRGAALRSLKAPGTAFRDPKLGGKDVQPDHMDDYVETAADQGGIHINSGIPNRAFYVTATTLGGYAWERAGRIWYLSLLELQPGTGFRDFANRTYAVATKEFGDDSRERAAVGRGWAAVGIRVVEP
ncbi:MAG: M4 family metallopeptidase, partial [Thermoanaerobaculia bacterium]